jgi:hypothetical protein
MNDPANILEGKVEILAYRRGELFYREECKNIILYQGQAEIIRALSTVSPGIKPRVIARMAVGDQGTIPSDPVVPKIPTKDLTGLYHEVYRKDIDVITPTLYKVYDFSYQGTTTAGSNIITALQSTDGVVIGMKVTGNGIPAGTVVVAILGPTSVKMSNVATSAASAAQQINFKGVVNECTFVAAFNAAEVPIAAFSNPSQPRINEVSLILIDPRSTPLPREAVAYPDAAGIVMPVTLQSGSATLTGLSSTALLVDNMKVTGPGIPDGTVLLSTSGSTALLSNPVTIDGANVQVNFTDEVPMTLRTFKSVPFEEANDISVTIRYTIYTE